MTQIIEAKSESDLPKERILMGYDITKDKLLERFPDVELIYRFEKKGKVRWYSPKVQK